MLLVSLRSELEASEQRLLIVGGTLALHCSTTEGKLSQFSNRNGAPEEIRTPDPQIRSLVLYPAELRARMPINGGVGRQ